MIEIIPAVLPRAREDIENAVARFVETPIKTIQVDLVDGNFASPKTWPYNSKHQYDEYKKLKEEGFPGWQDIDIELDLMISDPLTSIPQFIEWGPSRIIVHASSVSISEYQKFLEQHRTVQSFIHFGIAFGVDDDISSYKDIFQDIDFVQCMGIESIGKQGQDFDSRVIKQIQEIKKYAPNLPVSVDGGVSPDVAPKLLEAGAERLVSGSYLLNAVSVEDAIKSLLGELFSSEM